MGTLGGQHYAHKLCRYKYMHNWHNSALGKKKILAYLCGTGFNGFGKRGIVVAVGNTVSSLIGRSDLGKECGGSGFSFEPWPQAFG
jgi:hypothetical protein